MAAAGATIGSCYSTAATTTTTPSRLTTKHDSVLRISSNFRTPHYSSLSHSNHPLHDLLSYKITTTTSNNKWKRDLRIWCAIVEQEQVSANEPAIQTESSAIDEDEQTKPESAEDQGEEDTNSNKESGINTKLYFGNLPYNCDSAQLAGIIQEYGSPEMVEVLYDRDTGRSRGFAFVTMSSIEDANAVIQNLDGSEYGGRTLKVNFSDKPKPKEPLYPETDYKLFVGNLSWSVTSESLIQAFEEYGNVVGARVLYDGDTGRSRGYGFVCYSSKQEMDAALISLNGVELEGRAMRVSLAQGKRN